MKKQARYHPASLLEEIKRFTGLSYTDLSKYMGIPRTSLVRYSYATGEPPIGLVFKIARQYNSLFPHYSEIALVRMMLTELSIVRNEKMISDYLSPLEGEEKL